MDGTTGYDFLNAVNGLFVDREGRDAFDRIYAAFAGPSGSYDQLVSSAKKMTMLVSMASEINALAHQLDRIAERNRRCRDFTLNSLTFALREVIACLRVYRTYITGAGSGGGADRQVIESAVEEAKRRNPRTAEAVFDFVQDAVLLNSVQDFPEADRPRLVEWALKFQQMTGPIMAKSVEDTVFYTYNRLASLNEVGGSPDRFGVSVAAFHRAERRAPGALAARLADHRDARHQAERGRAGPSQRPVGDAGPMAGGAGPLGPAELLQEGCGGRAAGPRPQRRVSALPDPARRLARWLARRRRAWRSSAAESPNTCKRRRRRPRSTPAGSTPTRSTTTPCGSSFRACLPDAADDPFLNDLLAFQRRVAFFGYFNSLSQVLLKLTSPGVPDLYQGSRAVGFQPGRSRQSPCRRLPSARRSAGRPAGLVGERRR